MVKQYAPVTGDGDHVIDARIRQLHSVDEHVTAFAVSAHQRDALPARGVDAIGQPRLEALAEQRHLEVVAHPAVDRDERAASPRFTVTTRYRVNAALATMLRPGSMISWAAAGRCARAAPTSASRYSATDGGWSA